MPSYSNILNVVLPVYLTMALGFFLRRRQWLNETLEASFMKLCVMVLTPCLIFDRVLGNPSVMQPSAVLVASGLAFTLVSVGMGLSYLAGRLIGLEVQRGLRCFAVSCGLQNYGFVAIPIITALFPDKGTLGVLFTFTLGVELACWITGVGLLQGLAKAPWRLAFNPPVISILIALLMNFSGAHALMPEALMGTFRMLGSCAVPLAVLIIGASIAGIWGRDPISWPVTLLAPVLRLALIPMLFLACAWWLPISTELKRILIVQGAMPSAVFNIMIASHYGGHPPVAVQCVLSTTLVSTLTTPLFIGWALRHCPF